MGVLAVLPSRGEPRYVGASLLENALACQACRWGKACFFYQSRIVRPLDRSLNAHTRGAPRYYCKDPETAATLLKAALQELLRSVLRMASGCRTQVVYNQAHQPRFRPRHARLSERRFT
jgi:hypothetical protein